MNSRTTAGESRARPRTWVCWVATAASWHPRETRKRNSQEKLATETRKGNSTRAAVRPGSGPDDNQFCGPYREELAATVEAIVLLDIAGPLHFTFGRGFLGCGRGLHRGRARE